MFLATECQPGYPSDSTVLVEQDFLFLGLYFVQTVSTHEFRHISSKEQLPNPTNNVWMKYRYILSMLPLYALLILPILVLKAVQVSV
jgi:hypothetical protein